MIERGWCLSFIKKQINRVKKIFARAGRQELVTLPVDQALKAVDALRKGRSEAREKPPVTPEFDEAVEKSLPCLMPTVAMMVRVQRL